MPNSSSPTYSTACSQGRKRRLKRARSRSPSTPRSGSAAGTGPRPPPKVSSGCFGSISSRSSAAGRWLGCDGRTSSSAQRRCHWRRRACGPCIAPCHRCWRPPSRTSGSLGTRLPASGSPRSSTNRSCRSRWMRCGHSRVVTENRSTGLRSPQVKGQLAYRGAEPGRRRGAGGAPGGLRSRGRRRGVPHHARDAGVPGPWRGLHPRRAEAVELVRHHLAQPAPLSRIDTAVGRRESGSRS